MSLRQIRRIMWEWKIFSERISLVTDYILKHFDQKTYRGDKSFEFSVLQNISEVAAGKNGAVEEIKAKQRVNGFNSIFAIASVPLAMKYYTEFKKQMDADPTKALIENFIDGLNDVEDVMGEWQTYVSTERERELNQIIVEEGLNRKETRHFVENAFRDGEIKTTGTDIDRLMPAVSRFGGSGRAKKKQTVIDKLRAFFEKFFGIGGAFKAESEHKSEGYSLETGDEMSQAAETVEVGKFKTTKH